MRGSRSVVDFRVTLDVRIGFDAPKSNANTTRDFVNLYLDLTSFLRANFLSEQLTRNLRDGNVVHDGLDRRYQAAIREPQRQ